MRKSQLFFVNLFFALCSLLFAAACGGNGEPAGKPDGGSTDGQVVTNPCKDAASRCDDKIACTRDTCDESSGECRHQADHALCSTAGTICHPQDGCIEATSCATDEDCPDFDPGPDPNKRGACMQEYCDPASSACLWDPLDKDGDGYAPQICDEISGDDCNDDDSSVHPDAEEMCNGVDDDCDRTVDNILPGTGYPFYQDQDRDGYGNPEVKKETCSPSPPAGYVANRDDCDDTDPLISPNATEVCDGKDNNCDGDTDEPQTFYQDQDGDGYGNLAVSQEACSGSAPAGYVGNAGDCNDTDANITTDGCWVDSSSGLTWQNPAAEGFMLWQQAIDYCENLTLTGYSDWRLPTISELRSLIRGCPATESGGSCRVTDSCLDGSCQNDDECNGCYVGEGPAANGCYWPNEMEGRYCIQHWSSSSDTGLSSYAWSVVFGDGKVASYSNIRDYLVRCVRGGP